MTTTGPTTVTTLGERQLQITRKFHAPRHLVFDAHTTPALITQWLHGPDGWVLSVCEVDLRVGGRFRYVWRRPDGTEMGMGGVFREIVRPDRLVHTELFDQDWTGGETEVTSTFTEHAGVTTLSLTVLYVSEAARAGAMRTNFASGLDAAYGALDELLASPRHEAR